MSGFGRQRPFGASSGSQPPFGSPQPPSERHVTYDDMLDFSSADARPVSLNQHQQYQDSRGTTPYSSGYTGTTFGRSTTATPISNYEDGTHDRGLFWTTSQEDKVNRPLRTRERFAESGLSAEGFNQQRREQAQINHVQKQNAIRNAYSGQTSLGSRDPYAPPPSLFLSAKSLPGPGVLKSSFGQQQQPPSFGQRFASVPLRFASFPLRGETFFFFWSATATSFFWTATFPIRFASFPLRGETFFFFWPTTTSSTSFFWVR